MFSLFILLAATGCVNPYVENYTSALEKWPQPALTRILVSSAPATLVSSTDMKTDSHTLLQNGYVLLGRSRFKSALLDERAALAEAKLIGACLVLVNHKYDKTITVQVADVTTTPDQTVVNSRTFVNGRGEEKTITDTQTVQGTTQVNWVPENVDYYSYAATYWAQAKPSISGILVRGTTKDPLKPAVPQSGLTVRVIVTNSPAYEAGIQEGDILNSVAGVALNSVGQFYELVSQNAGKKVDVSLTRNGEAMKVSIALNSEQ